MIALRANYYVARRVRGIDHAAVFAQKALPVKALKA
jgi:hypothetical protein